MSTPGIYNHRSLQQQPPDGRGGPPPVVPGSTGPGGRDGAGAHHHSHVHSHHHRSARDAREPGGGSTANERINDALEVIRAEYDGVLAEMGHLKAQKDDLENKVLAQIQELTTIRQALYELEGSHHKIRTQYEDELGKLRRENDALRNTRGNDSLPPGAGSVPAGVLPLGPSSRVDVKEDKREPERIRVGDGSPSAATGPGMSESSLFNPRIRDQNKPKMDRGDSRMSDYYVNHPLDRGRERYSRDGDRDHPMTPLTMPSGPRDAPPSIGPGMPGGKSERDRDVMAREREQRESVYARERDRERDRERERERDRADRDRVSREDRMQVDSGPSAPPSSQTPAPASTRDGGPTAPQAPTPQYAQPVTDRDVRAFPEEADSTSVPPEFRKDGSDWFALFNPSLPRKNLDVALVHTLMHESVVCCVRFSYDGKYLATGCNRTAQIYDIKTGIKLASLIDETTGKTGDLYIRSVCFSPDGKYLATGAEDKQIRIWDINRKKIRNVFDGHQQEIYSLDFSMDGGLIVSGSGDKTARIWDMDTGTSKVLTINDPDSLNNDAGVTSVAISPDGRYVAAGSLDTVVRIWDVNTGQLLERLRGHRDSVYSVAFTPDGKGLVSGSLDKTLKFWEMASLGKRGGDFGGGSGNSPECKMNFVGHKDYVLSVAVSHDGQWVVSGSKDRGVQFWDAKNAIVQCMLQGHKNSVISIDLSPVGNMLATGSGDWQARIWRYKTAGEKDLENNLGA